MKKLTLEQKIKKLHALMSQIATEFNLEYITTHTFRNSIPHTTYQPMTGEYKFINGVK